VAREELNARPEPLLPDWTVAERYLAVGNAEHQSKLPRLGSRPVTRPPGARSMAEIVEDATPHEAEVIAEGGQEVQRLAREGAATITEGGEKVRQLARDVREAVGTPEGRDLFAKRPGMAADRFLKMLARTGAPPTGTRARGAGRPAARRNSSRSQARREGDSGDSEEPEPPLGGFPLTFTDRTPLVWRVRAHRARWHEWREGVAA
jgi:hypothetical protein